MRENIETKGIVSSSQQGIHHSLEQTLQRHLAKPWLQPLHQSSVTAYRSLRTECGFPGDQPFILDSGCGTGRSTFQLAERNPDLLVIGVDQSAVRLAKGGVTEGSVRRRNWMLLRAELATFWRLLLADGLIPVSHFLLYPNPWPKPGHLKRRWHGHPVFPVLLSLGGDIEMRCNWELYAQEFAHAACLASGSQIGVHSFQADVSDGISLFEIKYLQRGQKLFSVKIPASVSSAFRQSRSGDGDQF